MPHPVRRMELNEIREQAQYLDAKSVAREDLGKLGMPALRDALLQVRRELDVIDAIFSDASEAQIISAIDRYGNYVNLLSTISGMQSQQYARDREALGTELSDSWDKLRDCWPSFAAIAFGRTGLIEDVDASHKKLVEVGQQVEASAKEAELNIKTIAAELIKTANEQAKQIEANARKTAQGFSVRAAQVQFDAASKDIFHRALFWGLASVVTFGVFLWFSFHLYYHPPFVFEHPGPNSSFNVSEAIYLTAIRITVLTAFGALATFSLRMVRAHIHMSALNDHRRRVANSMAAFVESAQSPEQRD